jgi:hypothetical protein
MVHSRRYSEVQRESRCRRPAPSRLPTFVWARLSCEVSSMVGTRRPRGALILGQFSWRASVSASMTFSRKRSCCRGLLTKPRSPRAISPASRLKSTTWHPLSDAAWMSNSASTPSGHQDSTARKPTVEARENLSKNGTSANSVEMFAENRISVGSVASYATALPAGRRPLATPRYCLGASTTAKA